MNDIFAPPIPAENVLSNRFRVHPIIGDGMEPTFRGGRDYALLARVTTYEGAGIYLVDVGMGTELFRVTCAFDGKGSLRLLARIRGIDHTRSARSVSRNR